MKYRKILVTILILTLTIITGCSETSEEQRSKPPEKAITIDDMQDKIDIDNIILTKFTKTMTATKGDFSVILAMKDTVYDEFQTITTPYYYTILLPISIENMVVEGVKSIPAQKLKKLTTDEAAKAGIKVNSQAFAGEPYTFFSIEQSVEWNPHSNASPNLEGKYDFAIQNEDFVNAFYFSDIQLFVNGFNEKGTY
ncbi:hypothetical protein BMT55_12910 [Listeria newyorkensis]|uniref:Lipoprotein n=1 Tax=Listeria newyorkensis TaxID=1497681 RepID=A0ABX4XLX0_9LIST|nr:hypothetical protein [Listeria newyorkensis]KGL45566.1 hypothetical protein EP58_03625 [Listeria newyorkensis]PNP89391.1 hypothetical protein BMT55_12910 [Listeria newyorkensis]WAO22961.1 hypothetical protein OTR81_06760 [Listeria newyorkensis]SQC57208.1 Uncharacterised protein [Listeria newyorkensis]